jgi:hypothetical protein
MHGGGGQKTDYSKIYIEAPEEEARSVFYSRFGINADRVSCTCCGPDFSVSEYETLDAATEYERSEPVPDSQEFEYRVTRSVEEYIKDPGIKVIYADEITGPEKCFIVPVQGYVWRD